MMDLSDYTVLDLTWLLPGPYGTMLLGDLGADVIKIEEPERGDYARWGEPTVADTGLRPLFHAVNRNKRSVSLDLKTDEGTAAFLELAAEADVVIEQFRPGVVDRLDIDYESVKAVNEDVVYCSLTGFGQDGPYSDRAGHDVNYVSIAGLVGQTRSRGSERPTTPGFPVADMAGGMFAAFAVVSALLSRERGAGGTYLDVSMTDVVVSMATGHAWRALMDDVPEGEQTPSGEPQPYYGIYETADGKYVSIGALEEKFWNQLLAELGREDLADYQFATGEDAEYAIAELEATFEGRPRDEWLADLSSETTVTPVNEFDEVFEDPQVRARGMVTEQHLDGGGTVDHVGFPATTEDGIDDVRTQAPGLGDHTEEVLRSVLSADEFATLEDADAV